MRSTSASHHSVPAVVAIAPAGPLVGAKPAGENSPDTTDGNRRSACSTTNTPSPNRAAQVTARNGPCVRRIARHQVTERVGDRLEVGDRHADRQRRTERVADAAGVFDRDPAGLAGNAHLDGPLGHLELDRPGRVGAARGQLGVG